MKTTRLKISIGLTILVVLFFEIGVKSGRAALISGAEDSSTTDTGSGKEAKKSLADFPPAGPDCVKQSKVELHSLNLAGRESRCLAIFEVCGKEINEWGPRHNLMDLSAHECASFEETFKSKIGTLVCCDKKPPVPKGRPCNGRNAGFVYVSGKGATFHQEPSSDSPHRGGAPRGARLVYRDVTERGGHIWYHAEPPGATAGWVSEDELSCDRPPPLPPGKPLHLKDMNLLDAHPIVSITIGGSG